MRENLMSFFKIVRILFWCSSIYIALFNCFCIAYLVKGKNTGKNLENYVGKTFSKTSVIILCELIFAVGIFFSPPIYSHFENTNIGSFLEKETYRESYYVFIRKDKNETKSYRVKADIIKCDYGYPSYTDEGEETFITQGSGYFLERLYWDNDTYISFINDDFGFSSDARIYPGQETSVTKYNDDSEVEYYITLTTEKAK